jgi:hypothetical protein
MRGLDSLDTFSPDNQAVRDPPTDPAWDEDDVIWDLVGDD